MKLAPSYALQFLATCLFVVASTVSPQESLADPAVPSASSVLELANRVADWQLDNISRNRGEHDPKNWVWAACHTGIVKYAAATQQDAYLDAVCKIAEQNEWRLGDRTRHADDQAIGYVYGQLYKRYGDPQMLAATREQFDKLADLPYDESLKMRRSIVDREWAWCDALFMAPPTMFQLSQITGDPKYAEQADRLWWKTTDYLLSKDQSLYFRDSNFFNKKEPNGEPVFWSRGNGWVLAGCTRVLETLPKDDPRRQRYVDLYLAMIDRIVELQKPDGYWPAGLLDDKTWDQPESSGTAFYVYSLLWGVNHELLERERYLPPALQGWKALSGAVLPSGKLGWVQRIGAAPDSTGPEVTEPYATGGFLLAASELWKLALTDGVPTARIQCVNPLDAVRADETLMIDGDKLEAALQTKPTTKLLVIDAMSGEVCLSQWVEEHPATGSAHLLFQIDFAGAGARDVKVYSANQGRPAPAPRVFGRSVPERLDDFAWENDRIAYRVYGPALGPQNDADSGLDVWGKRVRSLIIDKWYASGDYHADHGEGLDFYKVGKSRGAGGIGLLSDDKLYLPGVYREAKLVASGPLRVSFELRYGPWDTPEGPITERCVVSLDANHSLNRIDRQFEGEAASSELPIAMGIEAGGKGQGSDGDRWLGYWGAPHGKDGSIGVGLVMSDLPYQKLTHKQTRRSGRGKKAFDETNTDLLAVTKVSPGQTLTYYAGACWSKSLDFRSADDWFHYLAAEAARRKSPVEVTIETP